MSRVKECAPNMISGPAEQSTKVLSVQVLVPKRYVGRFPLALATRTRSARSEPTTCIAALSFA